MNNKLTIAGIETIMKNAGGLDIFERNIYDGIIEQEQVSDFTGQEILDKVIYGAIKNTRSKVKEQNLAESALILVLDDDFSCKKYDCKSFDRENNILQALEKADLMLNQDKVDSVIIAVSDAQQGAAAIILKSFEKARADQNRIYAVIDSLDTEVSEISFSGLDYAEIHGKALEDILKTFLGNARESNRLSCALGTCKGMFQGISENMSFIISLIKTALCLYHRYIPGNPLWKTPGDRKSWNKTSFYIPTGSRTWFLDKGCSKRKAALVSFGNRSNVCMLLSEDETLAFRSGKYLAHAVPFCFPVAGSGEDDLKKQLDKMISLINQENNLQKAAVQNFNEFKTRADSPYALMIAAANKEDLEKEIRFMSKGIGLAFAKKSEFKTPKGSYFTANPLGKKGKAVFVYPGVGSAYLGLCQDIFHMFPGVYDQFSLLVSDMGKILKEKELYPRTCYIPTEDELKNLEKNMRKDIMDISECGISFSVIYTMIMAGYFKLFPQAAIGYSMGETSMTASLMVWQDPGQLSGKLKETDVFSRALHGELTAVRKHWGLLPYKDGDEKFIWESYTLLADRDTVSRAVEKEDRVYLTLINTDNEVVIAGDPDSCIRTAEKIGCQYFPLRLDLAIHSKPAWLEYDNIVDLFTLPTNEPSGIKFYSSSCYMPLPVRSKAIANSIARAFCDPVDFPKLVRKVHNDGGRIFIEAGPRQICSLWINEILKGQEFAAVPLNIKGTKDQVSIVRALAQLVSHRVNVDISPLFKFGTKI